MNYDEYLASLPGPADNAMTLDRRARKKGLPRGVLDTERKRLTMRRLVAEAESVLHAPLEYEADDWAAATARLAVFSESDWRALSSPADLLPPKKSSKKGGK